jgi:glucose/mannose-6-phosphate isomerase
MKKLADIAKKFNAEGLEDDGMKLAAWYKGAVPVIYASSRYFGSAYCMKIALNETGKAAAFCNAFPELNHNEMNGFGVADKSENAKYRVLILKFADDDKRVAARMEATAVLLRAAGVEVNVWSGARSNNPFQTVLQAMLIGEWAAVHLAVSRGADPEGVPMVEGLKKQMKGR